MKTTVSILWVNPDFVGQELVDDLRAICPEADEGRAGSSRTFSCEDLDENDPRLGLVLDRLRQAGMVPSRSPGDRSRQFWFVKKRSYSQEDLNATPLLLVSPKVAVDAGYRDDQGRIKLGINKLRPATTIALASREGWYVVPERTKVALESSGLEGLAFRETIPMSEKGFGVPVTWEKPGEPWWELRSSISMPPFSPTLKLTDGNGKPLVDRLDESNGVVPVEEFFDLPELRYTAESLRAMPAFALAHTYERVGTSPKNDNRLLIASHRFRDFCREQKMRIDWYPVRIDEA